MPEWGEPHPHGPAFAQSDPGIPDMTLMLVDDHEAEIADAYKAFREMSDLCGVRGQELMQLRADLAAAMARIATLEQAGSVALLTAHRACGSAEHDPAQGKIHGDCVVCGVPWPCNYADPRKLSRDLAAAQAKIAILERVVEALAVCEDNRGRFSWVPAHDCRCDVAREISRECDCGGDELRAAVTALDDAR